MKSLYKGNSLYLRVETDSVTSHHCGTGYNPIHASLEHFIKSYIKNNYRVRVKEITITTLQHYETMRIINDFKIEFHDNADLMQLSLSGFDGSLEIHLKEIIECELRDRALKWKNWSLL